jgi:DNA-binding Lrp family transcriptional regulator
MLDRIDQKIIEMLRRNARISNVDIAKKINRSESTIRQRIKKLEQKDIIKKYTIKVNEYALGYNSVAYVGINVHPRHLLRIIQDLTDVEEIQSLATTSGDYMIVCVIWAKDGSHLSKIIEQIESFDGVKDVLPSIIQERYMG